MVRVICLMFKAALQMLNHANPRLNDIYSLHKQRYAQFTKGLVLPVLYTMPKVPVSPIFIGVTLR